MQKLFFKSYEDLVSDIRNNIHLYSKFNFDLVVGIPRSGMIPSYLISAYLNIDCCDVDSFINNSKLQKGITRNTKANLVYPNDAKKVLLVDDSIYSGESLQLILDKIPINLHQKITKTAIYSTGNGKKNVDIYIEALEGKKLFEWGIYHNNLINTTCFDMDGVLCKDCLPEENDEGEKYLNFIKTAEPLFLPTKEIHSIVTNRLEKYREMTEEWLKINGVKYRKLVMLDLPNKKERDKIDAGIDHKGKYYKRMKDTELFIESSLNQSLSIARTSGKPVYCVDENKFIQPDLSNFLLNNSSGFIKIKYYKFKHALKPYLGWIVGK